MNTRLLVLGYLTYGPAHGYEMQKHMEESRVETWADVLPGSIYHALKQLTKEGFLEVQKTEQAGHRLRAVYALTEAGRQEFRRLLRHALTVPPRAFPTEFYTALSFLAELPREELRTALELLVPQLEEELGDWNEGEKVKTALLPADDHLRFLFQNGREHLEADLRMLRSILATLDDVGVGAPAPSFKVP